jgi:hypothetical protein
VNPEAREGVDEGLAVRLDLPALAEHRE